MTVKSIGAMVLALGLLSGCATVSNSQLNPFNWFGSDDEETLDPITVENERRPLVSEITNLVIERTPGGAIVRVTGLPPSQGWFAPELVNLDPFGNAADGVLSYSFRAVPPEDPTRVSTAQSRELSAAVFVPNSTLQTVRIIQVTGAQNSRVARR
jgi:hypothetical protein